MSQGLLVSTKDGKTFYTQVGFHKQLTEFANTFGAALSVVDCDPKIKLLTLPELATAFSTTSDTPKEVKSEDTPKLLPLTKESTNLIRTSIREKLLSGKEVSVDSLMKEFKEYAIDRKCISIVFFQTRKLLAAEGYSIVRLKRGKYVKYTPASAFDTYYEDHN